MNHNPENYLNRELSWLEFNQRVLNLAALDEIPLLERVKFLAITGSNMDEFIKVRVGGLRLAASAGSEQIEITGMNIEQQLAAINGRVRKIHSSQAAILLDQLLPELERQNFTRLTAETLSASQRDSLQDIFLRVIASTVAPIAIEQGRSFPLFTSARLCVAVRLRGNPANSMGEMSDPSGGVNERFVVIPIGNALPAIINVPTESGFSFMFAEDVIGMFLSQFFPDQEILEWAAFRLTRNADIVLDDDGMHDLIKEMVDILKQRKFSRIIYLAIAESASESMQELLREATECPPEGVFRIRGPIDLASLFSLASVGGFSHLKDQPWPSRPSPEFTEDSNIFETIAEADRMLIHPYQSFDPVVDFVRAAAVDPSVIAIKQTLYRTSGNSEIIAALVQAAGNGKQVTAIVELKARFDEARNIVGAQRLELAGADVIYGVKGLKTHAKVCLVVRKEPRGMQRYVHFGTGNYNESTARVYSDVSLFTNSEQLGSDANLFFNAMTGLSVPQPLQQLAAAPIDLKESLLELIQAEIEHAKRGGACQINAKLNSLVDKTVIDALYEASQAGVRIRLNIRGLCCLRPGVAGLSDNIDVISIVDRFLEHARIIHFSHAGDDLVFISSADWMTRSLSRRAELLIPILDKNCKRRLLGILAAYFKDNVRASRLDASGSYSLVKTRSKQPFRAQQYLYQQACDLYAAYSDPKATVFKAIRGESA